jgi:RNA polymerase sigma factor (sigma-70 family)
MSRSRARLDVAEVYRLHGRMVLRRARVILGDEEEARDALQELFMSLVNDPDKFRGESSIVTFLYRATTNLCLNRLRDRQNRSRLLDQRVSPVAGQARAPAAGLASEAQQLLAVLPGRLARVIVYAFIDEMTQEEIADMMQCSRKHVGHLIERARQLLLDSEERCA